MTLGATVVLSVLSTAIVAVVMRLHRGSVKRARLEARLEAIREENQYIWDHQQY